MIVVNNNKYDYLIVGAGVFGSVCAHELTKKGKRCLVIDSRAHIGGNCYTENINGIHVHKYGAHIFHTNDKKLWEYVNQFAEFKQYTHNVIADYKDEMYTLPFNMWTFNQMWGVNTPEEATEIIESQKFKGEITNLEEPESTKESSAYEEAKLAVFTSMKIPPSTDLSQIEPGLKKFIELLANDLQNPLKYGIFMFSATQLLDTNKFLRHKNETITINYATYDTAGASPTGASPTGASPTGASPP